MTVLELARRYPTAAEYISQIYLIIRDYSYCSNRRLAEFIGVSPSAVTQSASRLKKLGLTDQDKYGMISLTEEGRTLAEQILKRHYLLEYLMVRELGFPWDLADKEAEHLQDKISSAFLDHLCSRLGNPDRCPHGNPFPGNPQSSAILSAKGLDQFNAGDRVRVVRITEEGERIEGLLHHCYVNQVMPDSLYIIGDRTKTEVILLGEDDTTVTLPLEYIRFIKVEPVQL